MSPPRSLARGLEASSVTSFEGLGDGPTVRIGRNADLDGKQLLERDPGFPQLLHRRLIGQHAEVDVVHPVAADLATLAPTATATPRP